MQIVKDIHNKDKLEFLLSTASISFHKDLHYNTYTTLVDWKMMNIIRANVDIFPHDKCKLKGQSFLTKDHQASHFCYFMYTWAGSENQWDVEVTRYMINWSRGEERQ